MGKKIISLLCILFLLLPHAAWAQDKAFMSSQYKDHYFRSLAQSIPDRRTPDGSFFVFGDEPTSLNFARDKIVITVEKPFWQNLYYLVFHQKDYKEIQSLIEEYNRFYFAATASGTMTLFPQEHFVSKGIFEEANAHTFYTMFDVPDAGLGCEEGMFQYRINDVTIEGDDARVVIERSAEVFDHDERSFDTVIEEHVQEGYLLHKNQGEWKIQNIIFDNALYFDGPKDAIFNDAGELNTFAMFAESDDIAVWRDAFLFEKCQRKDYCSYGNYMSYIEGEITDPIFDYDKLYSEKNFTESNET